MKVHVSLVYVNLITNKLVSKHIAYNLEKQYK